MAFWQGAALAASAGAFAFDCAWPAHAGSAGLIPLAAGICCGGAALAIRLHERGAIGRLGTAARALAGADGDRDRSIDGLASDLRALNDVVASGSQRLAQRHPVTNLATREPLLAAIRAHIAADTGPAQLAIFELADFDRLNAFDGTAADRALAAVAERVVRMVGAGRLVAHVDRARIAIWFPAVDPATAARSIEAIGYALGDTITTAGAALVPDIRTGCASFPRDAATAETLITRAFAALAAGNADGTAADGDPAAAARDRYALEQDLRQAVARSEFTLRFQPLIDAAGARVCGAEALLRWQHPARGLIMPSAFVPAIEESGLADEVGMWTLNAACREARGWRGAGIGDVRVAVNLSAQQLHRDDLATLIERTLGRHRLSPAALEIELTETIAAGDVARTRSFFAALRLLGVAVSIDDFGTGYSSLAYLKKLSFDKLKIDREFVTRVDARSDSQAICASIIALGRGLGITVLAEGVERHEEYEWLRRHGCTLFQGYYFAQPLEPEAFVDFARDRSRLKRLTALGPAALRAHINERMAS